MSSGRLPNLLVVGVPKAGTGSLFDYLSQHPQICGSDEKEVGYFNFFDPRRHPGPPPPLDAYSRHFAHCADEAYAVEATPNYCYNGQPVIDAIRRTLPSVRIVLSLRNPVDRLWSAYTFQRELGNLSKVRSFEQYVDILEQRRREHTGPVPRGHLNGLHIGYYGDYVPLWLSAFGDDIRIVFAEDLFRDPMAVVVDLLRWLRLDTSALEGFDLAPRNRTQHPRSVRAARLAYSVKRAGERIGVLPSQVREPLRRLYVRANAGSPPERLSPEMRMRVTDLYRDSTDTTARALAAHGYRDLPAWLGPARAG
jgi:hypothetical protein